MADPQISAKSTCHEVCRERSIPETSLLGGALGGAATGAPRECFPPFVVRTQSGSMDYMARLENPPQLAYAQQGQPTPADS